MQQRKMQPTKDKGRNIQRSIDATKKDATKKDATKEDTTKKDATKQDATNKK